MRYEKKKTGKCDIIHRKKKREAKATVFEEAQMAELADKDFKAVVSKGWW